MTATEFQTTAQVCKVDARLGLVFGYAVVCKQNGTDYYDLQDEHVPEDVMLEAATDFMRNSRMADEMHDFAPQGEVVFAFPMTTDVAKALGIEARQTGLLIGMRPSPEVLRKFEDGTYTGFSIGGRASYAEEVA